MVELKDAKCPGCGGELKLNPALEKGICIFCGKEIIVADATATKTIDGRLFSIRVFFPEGSAETIQEKIERMLHSDIVKAIRKTAA